jgi:hypothetical protein
MDIRMRGGRSRGLWKKLLKEDWPDHQWRARLYHWLRPPRHNQPVGFD